MFIRYCILFYSELFGYLLLISCAGWEYNREARWQINGRDESLSNEFIYLFYLLITDTNYPTE